MVSDGSGWEVKEGRSRWERSYGEVFTFCLIGHLGGTCGMRPLGFLRPVHEMVSLEWMVDIIERRKTGEESGDSVDILCDILHRGSE